MEVSRAEGPQPQMGLAIKQTPRNPINIPEKKEQNPAGCSHLQIFTSQHRQCFAFPLNCTNFSRGSVIPEENRAVPADLLQKGKNASGQGFFLGCFCSLKRNFQLFNKSNKGRGRLQPFVNKPPQGRQGFHGCLRNFIQGNSIQKLEEQGWG